ncbi:MAG: hypothetical protein MI784_15185 [Cytophagales bacterium]|nr:hypothetical protein [Cytophagales bacterium]
MFKEGANSIVLKWYTPKVLNNEGVHIFRQENGGQWVRMTQTPVRRKQEFEETLDEEDNFWETLAEEISKGVPLNGLIKVQFLVKTFMSEKYSDYLGIKWEDKSARKGNVYRYKAVRLKNQQEYVIGVSKTIEWKGEKRKAAPEEFDLVLEKKEIKLKWKLDEYKYYGYNVYRQMEGEKELKMNERPIVPSAKVDEKTGKETYPEYLFVDKIKKDKTYYSYRVEGLDFFNRASEKTRKLGIASGDVTPPYSPIDLTDKEVNPLEGRVVISWTPRYTEDVAGIYLSRSMNIEGPFVRLSNEMMSWDDSVYVDTSISRSGNYYYRATAVDGTGNEAHSLPVLIDYQDVIPPSSPRGILAQADSGLVRISWEPNAEDDLMGYQVYRSIVAKFDKDKYILINGDPIADTLITQRMPVNVKNRFYYFAVAVDSSYNRSKPSELVSVQFPDVVPPERPQLKAVVQKGNFLEVEWLPNVDEDLAGYHMYRKSTIDSVYRRLNIAPIPAFGFRYVDRSAEQGVVYQYALAALDSASNHSAFSDALTGKLRATKNRYAFHSVNVDRKRRNKRIKLQWETDIPENKLRGYVVFRRTKKRKRLEPVTSLTKETAHVDRSLDPKKRYVYQIKAFVIGGRPLISEEISAQ